MGLRITSKGFWSIGFLAFTLAACGGGKSDDSGNPGPENDAGASSEQSSGASGGLSGEDESEEGGSTAKSSAGGADQEDSEASNEAGASTTPEGGKSGGTTPNGNAGAGGTTSVVLPDPDETNGWLDKIGEACESECDQQFALECPPAGLGNSLVCQLNCAATTAQLGDFCLPEYAAYVACRADGGYDCVSGNPYPRSTCAKEQLAFTQCTQYIGCKRACQKTLALGCNDESFESCVDACTTIDPRVAASDSSICPHYYNNIATCQAQYSAACAGDQLEIPATCARTVLNVAECIDDHSGELCEGWCFAAEKLGCGSEDCVADCAEKKADTSCGTYYSRLLDCGLLHGDAACTDTGLSTGTSSSSSCDYDLEQYQNCLESPPTAP